MPVPSDLALTPFHEFTPESVEEFIDVYGFAVPLWITDPASEYDAVRNRVGISEFSMLYKWDLQGPGARQAADAVFSRDLANLGIGRIAYGVITTTDGLMVDDCTAFVHADDHIRIIGGNPATEDYLSAASPAGVSITERRGEFAVLSVQGPASRALLQRLTDADISNDAFPYYTFRDDLVVAGVPAQVNRLGFTAELGYEVMVGIADAAGLYRAVLTAGADLGVQAFAAAALMMCRVEAGMIMGELEYDHTTSPYECRMGWAVDLDKAPWTGQARLRERKATDTGRVVTVRVEAEPEAAEGQPLLLDGSEVGTITMAVPSPVLGGATLAMARIHRDAASVGTTLRVQTGQGEAAAVVVATPVYDPERRRVRG